jgi:hypothetical protein
MVGRPEGETNMPESDRIGGNEPIQKGRLSP